MRQTATGLGLCLVALLPLGCSMGSSDSAADAEQAAKPAAPADPIAASAYAFMDAVFDGDSARADQQLTPTASAEMATSGQRFAPPGSGPTGFEIGAVKQISDDRAAVECLVSGTVDGAAVKERLGCLLRKVGDQWLVSGVAYEVSPGGRATIIDFERPTNRQQPVTPEPQYVATPSESSPGSPIRTAAGPQPTTIR
ncbi:MAG: hypothetical protein AAF596_10230 [Planctomycetota bacterium]